MTVIIDEVCTELTPEREPAPPGRVGGGSGKGADPEELLRLLARLERRRLRLRAD